MEPLSIIGAVAACGELVTMIARVTSNLHTLKTRWTDGARSLQLLIGKLSSIRAALIQIKDWAEFNASTSPNGEEMRDSLGVAIEGCQVIIEALGHDVERLGIGDSVVSRLKQLFFDSTIRDHEGRLDSQVTALQLLLNAAYCQTLSEQNSFLRQTATREIFQRVREDTSTVREQSTVRDAERSTIAGTEPNPARASRRLDRIDSFPETETASSVGYNGPLRPAERERETEYRDPTWQRPTPFEMLPYGASPPPISPSSDRSTTPSSFFSLTKVMSSNTSLSTESQPKSQPSSIRQRFSRLRLSGSSSRSNADDTMSPKSQLSIRFPGELTATDMYLQSDGDRPPPKPIVAAQRGDHAEMASLIRRRADIDQPHSKTGRTPLAIASHCGHNDIVELLIAEGARIKSKDKRHLSPLHLAAANGHCSVIETLLDRDADINARGPHGKTPLRVACEHGQLDVIRLLAKRRATIDARDDAHKTALHAASDVGDNEIVKLLLQLGANKDAKDSHMRTPLHSACINGRVAVAETLIEAKADIEAQEEEDLTPLAAAARSGLTAIVELLLRYKASPRTRSAGNFTPLHWASYNSHEEVVGLLIGNKKTELNAQSINGRTPLHVAAMGRSFGVIEKLVGAGAQIEVECHESSRPLHYACQHATHSEVSLLLTAGASCNVVNRAGETPLHIATRVGNTRVSKALVARGARIDATDFKGVRPLAIACSAGHAEITHFLLASGAVVKGATDTPVCLAASGGHVQVIQALLQHGAAVREVDAQGWDPLRRAAFAGHSEAVACLLGNGARATDLGSPSSFSFASTATPEQRERIRDLLTQATQSENAEYQRVTYLASAATRVNEGRENITELPDTAERSSTDRGSLDEHDASRPPPATPSRPPPPIPEIRRTDTDGEPETEPYYYERESTRPAPYFAPPESEPIAASTYIPSAIPLPYTPPYIPLPGPMMFSTPGPANTYQPGNYGAPYLGVGASPGVSMMSPQSSAVSPPTSMMSPPTSGRISPPMSMTAYSTSGVSTVGSSTSGYYSYDRYGQGPGPRPEALYPIRTGTDGNRAELA